jgi:hypothetical protein
MCSARAAGRVQGWEDRRAARCASLSGHEDESELEEDASESGPSIGGGAGRRNGGGGGGGDEGEEGSGDSGFGVVRHVEVEEV